LPRSRLEAAPATLMNLAVWGENRLAACVGSPIRGALRRLLTDNAGLGSPLNKKAANTGPLMLVEVASEISLSQLS